MSKSLDQEQARHFVGPDLGPNYLQWLVHVAEYTGKQIMNVEGNGHPKIDMRDHQENTTSVF